MKKNYYKKEYTSKIFEIYNFAKLLQNVISYIKLTQYLLIYDSSQLPAS